LTILFLSDNFPPEVNAPATRTYEHCLEWVKQGIEVIVITCVPNFPQGKVYPGFRNKLIQKETLDGIKVIRTWSYISANEGVIRRTIDYISFGISSFLTGIFINADLIIATSPQFFTALSGRKLSYWKGIPWVMEVRDLWPESIKNVNAIKQNFIIKYLEWEEIKCYKKANGIVTVTDTFRKVILKKGIKDKIKVIKNGANLTLFKPRNKNQKIINNLNLQNKFVVGYFGTHGMAHKLDFIVACAAKITDPDIHFLFVGAGAEKKKIQNISKELRLTNITFLETLRKDEIADFISITDISLIPLKKSELFKTVIPSKIFENAAMQKPILLGVDGESRIMIEKYNAGLFFEPENEISFLSQLFRLKNDTVLYQSCQQGGEKLALDFKRERLAKQMLDFLISLV